MKLSRKITLLFLGPFVVMLAILGYRATQREIGIYESQVSTDLVLMGRALRPTFAEAWRVEGEGRALQLIDVVDRDVSEVKIQWIAREKMPGMADIASEVPVIQIEPATNDSAGRISVFVPVLVANVPPGVLALSRSLESEAQIRHEVVRERGLATALAVVVAIAIGGAVGAWFIGRPVRSLVLHARRIGGGDLARVPTSNRSDELGQLANELNATCAQLADARVHLEAEAEARFKALEQLRHADRLSTVGKLAAGLAHELGTPLNVVSGRAKMISSGKLAPEAVTENATIIGGQAARMTKIIRGLLDFARRGALAKGPTDLGELAQRAVELLAPLSKKRGIGLTLEGAETPRILAVDAGQIEQVLANLVTNAVDATPDGGAVIVHLAEEEATPPAGLDAKSGLYLRLDVRDEGTGIRKEDLARVFEPFFTTKEVGQGTGLGLSVAHGIVDDHGGWIAVRSEPNHGSCFSVYLPKTHS